MGLYLSALSSLVRPKETERITMAEFPEIKSKHSLVAKHVTKEKWDKLSGIVTKTSGFTLAKTPTSTSLMSSTPSSVNTTVSQLDSNTFPTWMSRKSRETSPMMSQYTLSEFVLDDLSKDSVSPPESPRNNVLELKSS